VRVRPVDPGEVRPMTTIDAIVRSINRELSPQFEERLRVALADQDRGWLIDQIVRLTLDAHSLEEFDRAVERADKDRARAERLERVRALRLDALAVAAFHETWAGRTREQLVEQGELRSSAPAKGGRSLAPGDRSPAGEDLLRLAKDVLFGLLFGDASSGTRLARVQAELLTLAVPRSKAGALDFLRASTELVAAGTWQDPSGAASDDRADNLLIEVQYGETADELVGRGIVTALALINNLEINEQVLYARMINIEDSTLII
jgi:hypothetical protein